MRLQHSRCNATVLLGTAAIGLSAACIWVMASQTHGTGIGFAPEPSAVTSWAKRRHVRGAFVCLVGPNRTAGIALALQSLHINILRQHPRPVLLFYGDDIHEDEYSEATIAGYTPPEIRSLIEVHMLDGFLRETLPERLRGLGIRGPRIAAADSYPGYQAMCHFFFDRIFTHPRIRQLDYYFRFDTDTRITSPVDVDIFDHMAVNGYLYGWTSQGTENGNYVKGLANFAADFLGSSLTTEQRDNAIANGYWDHMSEWTDEAGQQKGRFKIIWNEVEVVNVPRFLQADVRDFVDAVNATQNVWTQRWGDSPLRQVEVIMFLNQSRDVTCLKPLLTCQQDKGNRWLPPTT